jgi:hypothetical protein
MRATDASKNAFQMGCGGWFNPLISPKNPHSDGTGTIGKRPNKASKTAAAENCNHLRLSILWDENRPSSTALTRARSRMVAMHPAALMKSEIECL